MIRTIFLLILFPAFCLGNTVSEAEKEFLQIAKAYLAKESVHLEVFASEFEKLPLHVAALDNIDSKISYSLEGIFRPYSNPSKDLLKAFEETNISSVMRSQEDDVPTDDYLRIQMGIATIFNQNIGAEIIYKITSTPPLGCRKSTIKYYQRHCTIHLEGSWYVNYSVYSKENL